MSSFLDGSIPVTHRENQAARSFLSAFFYNYPTCNWKQCSALEIDELFKKNNRFLTRICNEKSFLLVCCEGESRVYVKGFHKYA